MRYYLPFIFAHTLYIPYVGGHINILSLFGLINIRINKSIASSLPTPQNILSTFKSILYIYQYVIWACLKKNKINKILKRII